MPRKRRSTWILAALLALLTLAPSFAEEGDEAAALAQEITGREGFQSDWPERESRDPPAGSWLVSLGLTGLFFWIFVAAVAAIALLLLLFIVRELLERRYRGRDEAPADAPIESIPPWLAGELDDPERLAERGDYAEAIHALLLQSLRQLIVRSRRPLGDSLTSREVALRLELGERPRAALWELLQVAERVVFGEEPTDRDAYLRCRAHYELLREGGA